METKKYSFIGTGSLANQQFRETFDSPEAAVRAAVGEYYDTENDDKEYVFGYVRTEQGVMTSDICPIISVLEVKDFDTDRLTAIAADDVMDCFYEMYGEFESGVDDGEFLFKEGFKEEFAKVVAPLVKKYGYATGIQSVGHVLYRYNIETGETI